MEIGSFVRQERRRLGLTQQELADKSHVGLNFVYQLEKNKTTVQLDKTNQVLRSLGYELGAIRFFNPWANDDLPTRRAGATKHDTEPPPESASSKDSYPAMDSNK